MTKKAVRFAGDDKKNLSKPGRLESCELSHKTTDLNLLMSMLINSQVDFRDFFFFLEKEYYFSERILFRCYYDKYTSNCSYNFGK